jgi:transcriptional repressor NrdR
MFSLISLTYSQIFYSLAGRLSKDQLLASAGPLSSKPFRSARSSMKCPFCGHLEDKVVDSRESREGEAIRRRRECLKCSRRFTSYERIDEVPYMVIKKDGRRERFDRQKILAGLLKACEKRPVSTNQLEEIVTEVEYFVQESNDRERSTQEIGEVLMERLRKLDKVAYVRFASVYLDFKDVKEFMAELRDLLKTK